jgi:hypothetical protein
MPFVAPMREPGDVRRLARRLYLNGNLEQGPAQLAVGSHEPQAPLSSGR